MVGKQGHPTTRAVTDLVLMIRHPSGEGAGVVCDKLIYNHDVIATLLSLIGDEMSGTVDGLDVWPAIDPSAAGSSGSRDECVGSTGHGHHR